MRSTFPFSRRDFLKLASVAPLAWFVESLAQRAGQSASADKPNIIILVFDAWSARDVSLYGYPRQTMPNLERFAGHATVYHNHHSAATFTVPGTASLVTGLYPWSHRAFQLGGGIVPSQVSHQMFAALSGTQSRVAYAQNRYADLIVSQANAYLDRHVPIGDFDIENSLLYSLPIFKKDVHVAYASLEDNIVQVGKGYDSSLFFGPLYRLWVLHQRLKYTNQFGGDYPLGLPDSTELFELKDIVDGAIGTLGELREPALAYLHFHPPHDPYHPTAEFADKFADDWRPVDKPIHPLASDQNKRGVTNSSRRFYDQYLASWDQEVSRLFDYLKSSGLLDRSYVFVTSDHGEMFERGEVGHWTRLMFGPVMHVPLLVSSPGQSERRDIHAYTSNVDILPTAAHLTDNPIPAWAEGQLLPGLGGVEDPGRSIYVVDAKTNPSFSALDKVSIALTRNAYRLAYYKYADVEQFEFYNLEEDPEELQDLFPSRPAAARAMQDELLQKLSEVNRPYTR